jgi:hypothetical protein
MTVRMTYLVTATVADVDEDLAGLTIPDAIRARFLGTAVNVESVELRSVDTRKSYTEVDGVRYVTPQIIVHGFSMNEPDGDMRTLCGGTSSHKSADVREVSCMTCRHRMLHGTPQITSVGAMHFKGETVIGVYKPSCPCGCEQGDFPCEYGDFERDC